METINSLFPDEREKNLHLSKHRQTQLIMLRLLKIINHICKEYKISYWLEGGTLLGAIRHKGFIPWDDDIDIGMLRKDYEKFYKVFHQIKPHGLFLQTHASDKNYLNPGTPAKLRDTSSIFLESGDKPFQDFYNGIFLDIFIFDHNVPNNTLIQKLRYKNCKTIRKLLRNKVYFRNRNKIKYRLLPRNLLMKYHQLLVKKSITNNQKYIDYGFDSGIERKKCLLHSSWK